MRQKTIIMLLVAAACLIGVCMAEPQPVDGGWHRSDEVPAETPTAAPPDGGQHSSDGEQAPSGIDAEPAATTATEPQPGDGVSDADAAVTMVPEAAERRMDVGGLVAVGLCGLLALTALWCCLRWGRAK